MMASRSFVVQLCAIAVLGSYMWFTAWRTTPEVGGAKASVRPLRGRKGE